MEKLDEVLQLLKTALPLLEKFNQWQEMEAEKQKVAEEIEAESEKEFSKWLEDKKKAEAQQEKDAEELQKHFFGGQEWERERFAPNNY